MPPTSAKRKSRLSYETVRKRKPLSWAEVSVHKRNSLHVIEGVFRTKMYHPLLFRRNSEFGTANSARRFGTPPSATAQNAARMTKRRGVSLGKSVLDPGDFSGTAGRQSRGLAPEF
jgi:hypothetical protein